MVNSRRGSRRVFFRSIIKKSSSEPWVYRMVKEVGHGAVIRGKTSIFSGAKSCSPVVSVSDPSTSDQSSLRREFPNLRSCCFCRRPMNRILAEPLGINITAESFTEKGDTPFGPLERSGVPELLDGLHTFGICAHVEVFNLRAEALGITTAKKYSEMLTFFGPHFGSSL